jgi:hypothetical protein
MLFAHDGVGQRRHGLGDNACVVDGVISSGSGKMAMCMEGSTGVGNDGAVAQGRTR